MYEVRKDVPMPNKGSGGCAKYPWRTLKVGDSFFVPRTDLKREGHRPVPSKNIGIKVMTRKWCEDKVWGVMIWRTA